MATISCPNALQPSVVTLGFLCCGYRFREKILYYEKIGIALCCLLEVALAAPLDNEMVSAAAKKRLCQARKSLGLTQKDAAKKAGLSLSTYNSLESGDRELRAYYIDLLCRVFEISPNWLLGFDNNPLEKDLPEGISQQGFAIGTLYDNLSIAEQNCARSYMEFLASSTSIPDSGATPSDISNQGLELGKLYDTLPGDEQDSLNDYISYLSMRTASDN